MEDVYFTILTAVSIVETVAFLLRKQNVIETYFGEKENNLQAHDLVLLIPIVLNYHRYFVFGAFLDI